MGRRSFSTIVYQPANIFEHPSRRKCRKFLAFLFTALTILSVQTLLTILYSHRSLATHSRTAKDTIYEDTQAVKMDNLPSDIPYGNMSNLNIHHIDYHNYDSEVMEGISIRVAQPLQGTESDVAIGLAISGRGIVGLTSDNMEDVHPFFKYLLPSFCKTASAGFNYHFYLSHDHEDPLFNDPNSHEIFKQVFISVSSLHCSSAFANTQLHLVGSTYMGKPVWAQNDAMMEAYIDHIPFYYRITDDTVMETTEWTVNFIAVLNSMHSALIGVAGPTQIQGNSTTPNCDFVHRTHIDIFGYYYSPLIKDGAQIEWITGVYSPDHAKRLPQISVSHVIDKEPPDESMAQKIAPLVQMQRHQFKDWLTQYKSTKSTIKNTLHSTRVISFSLYGENSKFVLGAIRNANLIYLFYPEWKMRVYVENPQKARYPLVPTKYLDKLQYLGCEILQVDTNIIDLPPMMWRYLAADDMSLDLFLVRDTDTRLSNREAALIDEWVNSGEPFHCIRDHPSHVVFPLGAGLVGGVPRKLKTLFDRTWTEMMQGFKNEYHPASTFLEKLIWPVIKDYCFCHDSFSCLDWPGAHPFPIARVGWSYVGQQFSQYDWPHQDGLDIIATTPLVSNCVKGPFYEEVGPSNKKDKKQEGVPQRGEHRRLIFWSQDFKTEPINDLKTTLIPLGVLVNDQSLSEHCYETGTCASELKVIDSHNGMDLKPNVIEEFYDTYKDDPIMDDVDAFVCLYPASMCEAFIQFNKTLIIIPATRYELGRHEADRWEMWNKRLVQLYDSGNHVIGVTNTYDSEYIQYFTGIKPMLLPPLCDYIRVTYTGYRDSFLLGPMRDEFQYWFSNTLRDKVEELDSKVLLYEMESLYPDRTSLDLAVHRGIIHVPLQVSSIDLYEQYRMNIPLFFPSVNLLTSWHMSHRVVKERCSALDTNTNGSPIKGIMDVPDPNDEETESALHYWLKFADWYEWPHVIHFDSLDDLIHKLKNTNLKEVSSNMKKYNAKTKKDILDKWNYIISSKFS